MLKKNLLLALLAVFSLLSITTSCEKTEPMQLVPNTNINYQYTISVPAEGKTMHLSTNYESFWFSENSVTVDGQPFKAPNSKAIDSVLSTPWLKAIINKNVVTVVVEPNTTSKVRTTRLSITAGDGYTSFIFEQEAKK